MPWIFSLFLVTLCALTSCHVVISKQDSTIRAVEYNWCVTGRRPCDENHAVRFRQCWELQSSKEHAADQRSLWRACKEVQALAPPGSWKKIWEEEVLSLSICLSTHLSHTTETSTLSRIKCDRYIFLWRSVFNRSLKFVNLRLIMFPLIFVFVLWLYNKIPANECPVYDIKQSDDSSNAGTLENMEYSFNAMSPRSTLACSGST